MSAAAVVLVAKLTLTPLLIAAATLAARRWGSTVGGLLAGLPLTSGPVSVFLAVEHGPAFAAVAARATLLGLIGVAAFCMGYARAATVLGWFGSWAAGMTLWTVAVLGLSVVQLSLSASVAAVVSSIVAATLITREVPAAPAPAPAHVNDLPWKIATATGMVLIVTAAAGRLGPTWSGFLSPFPVFASVMAVFSHMTQGPGASIGLLRGVIAGSFAFAGFFVVVTLQLERSGVAVTYSLAAVAAVLVNVVSLRRLRRISHGAGAEPRGDSRSDGED
jgi:hypothetical protein